MTDTTITAARAVQMSKSLKEGPRTVDELASLTGLERAAIRRWLSHMQMFDRVRAGGTDGLGPWYRWTAATDQQVAEFAAMHEAASERPLLVAF